MDWLVYLGLGLSTMGVLAGGIGLLLAWCWPGLYAHRFVAWAYGEKVIGNQCRDRTWYALWSITSGLTALMLLLKWTLPGLMMLGAFLFCCFQLRDRLYIATSSCAAVIHAPLQRDDTTAH